MTFWRKFLHLARKTWFAFIVTVRGIDASHCATTAARDGPALEHLLQHLSDAMMSGTPITIPSLYQAAIIVRFVVFGTAMFDALWHAYKAAKRMGNNESNGTEK